MWDGPVGKGARAARTAAARRAVVVCALAGALALVLAQAASAGLQKEIAVFEHCPVEDPSARICVVSTTTSGEFKIGNKDVKIDKPVILQGGLTKEGDLVPAVGAETLSRTPLHVPGGLVGLEVLEVLGPLNEVTATAELAGTAVLNPTATNTGEGTAAVFPLKVKLDNPVLGPACYIGSDSEPMTPHLTTGTTSPPEGVAPITGSHGTASVEAHGHIITLRGTSLVDNTFPAPGVNGCGGLLAPVADPAADLLSGLPAGPGTNTAILNGDISIASVRNVVGQRPLPELGRCVKVPGEKIGKLVYHHGNFRYANCIEEEIFKQGSFEFLPGPGEHKKFTTKTGTAVLETTGHYHLKCVESHGAGEYTGPKSATQTITFTGCTTAAGSCHSAGAGEGEIATPALQETLGFIQDAEINEELHVSAGWDLAHEPSIISATCGSSGQSVLLTGSVIGTIAPVEKMVGAYTVKYAQSAGKQLPEAFEEKPNDTLSMSLGGAAAEQTGLKATNKITNEEKLLFKTEQEE